MTETRDKISALQRLMRARKLDAYLVPSTDAHLSEYVPACWERRGWLTGFTGSSGDVLVTLDGAGLWTDGRYFLQAEQQLEGSGIELFRAGDPGVPLIEAYVAKLLLKGQRLGADPRVLSLARASALEKALADGGATVALVEDNLVDAIWKDRPSLPQAPLEVLPTSRTGESCRDKLTRVRAKMTERRADAHVITTLDTIAWLFNIRGSDVDYNPVVIAYALVTHEAATLFVAPGKVTPEAARKLGKSVTVRPYDDFKPALRELAARKARVWIDKDGTNRWVVQQLRGSDLVTETSPIMPMKARKNAVEIDGMREAHVRDGVAMVRFLRWLGEEVPGGHVTELSAEQRLGEFRGEGLNYRGPSFRTIAGFNEHGAIIHYAADEDTNVTLRSKGIFLVDSGGQYLDGTTDITRTVSLGGATAEQRRIFTLVLKGHIALSRAKFPTGVRGMRLDTLARAHMWSAGLDYNHGTGHGVGAYLGVHEGPQSISPLRCTGAPVEEGNILSNEPGYYAPGKYGIRIENLVLVVRDEKLSRGGKTWLGFEPLTLCPIDTALVDAKLLDDQERAWLNAYHKRVAKTLSPLLADPKDRRWLARACKAVGEN